MAEILIDTTRCKHCGSCVEICPEGIFFQVEKGTVPQVRAGECLICGHCVALCPTGAIHHEDFPAGSIHPIHPEMRPTPEQVLELIRIRRSVREFRPKPVSREVIEQLLEAARFAPSAHNAESTEFVVIRDRATLDRIVALAVDYLRKTAQRLRNPVMRRLMRWVAGKELEGAISGINSFDYVVQAYTEGRDLVLHQAPVLILFHGDRKVGFAGVNANLALQNATLMAEALGLGCFYTGFIVAPCDRDDRIARLLNLPPDHKIYGGLALGYPRFKYHHWLERRPARVQWLPAEEAEP